MIYLIDDKKSRQTDFGWTDEKFAQYASYLTPLYNIDDVANIGEQLYNDGNIILYHESFLDFTLDKDKAVDQRKKLLQKTESNTKLEVGFFSGSQSARSLNENTAYLPVSTLYQNLSVVIQQNNNEAGRLKYLLFGEQPEIEQELNDKLTQANIAIKEDPAEIEGKNLFIRPTSKFIQNAIKGSSEGKIFNDVSDEKLSEMIIKWLDEEEYDNIFIPICFGQTLTDFNGLRLATHIRCSPSPNQLKRIFVYSFVAIDYLLNNEYFNILKTKNVQLVAHSKKAFEAAVNKEFTHLRKEDLSQEINKLKLEPPLNYADSHSIANEWAIHQWAKTIGCYETDGLAKVFQNVETNLYFKYLRTTNPLSEIDIISPEKLNINFEGNSNVFLIDDELEKGWDEIFGYLLMDVNELDLIELGYDFKNKNQDEIIDISIKKIEKHDIDVVILDFRLKPNDFAGTDPEDISSIRLLKKIKEINPGIQVIIFSATNKVWNLQALQNAGADGFIFKDGGTNINQTINSLIVQMSLSLEKASWLKPIWYKTKSCIDHLETQERGHYLDRDFTGAISTFLELGFDSMVGGHNKFPFDSSFMYYFLIIEASSKQLIDEDNPIEVNHRYKFQFRSNYDFLKYFNETTCERTNNVLMAKNRRIPYNQKFLNLIEFANIQEVDPFELVSLRNSFNHPNLVENRRIAVIEKDHLNKIFEVCYKLINKL
ncbi:response regulator [bacterium]|nr:response regulator [bacterium]